MSHQQVLRQAGLLPECIATRRQGLDPCIIRAGAHAFPPDQEIRLHDGLGLTIDVPMIIDEARWQRFVMPRLREIQQDGRPPVEPDATSLMARRPQARRTDSSMSVSSRTSTSSDSSSYSSESPVSWKRAVVYALDGQTHSVLLPWREGDELYTRIAVAFGVPSSSILQLHHVGFRPGDLEQMELQALLLQQHHEVRPAPNLQLILLDLEIHEDNPILPGIFRRKAHWAPKITTIDTLFRVLGLTSTYRQHADESHLWLNNIRIDLQRNTPLHIADGDYVEIFSEIWNVGTHFAVLAKRKMKRRFFYKYPHTMITRFLINSNDMSPAWTLVVQMNAFTGMEVIDNVNLQTLTQSIVPDVPSGTDLNYNNLTSKTSQSWL